MEENLVEYQELISDLIEKDLVEYVVKEEVYYLTYEGYEYVDELRGLPIAKKDLAKSNSGEYREIVDSFGRAKSFQKMTLGFLFCIGILSAIYFYFNPDITWVKNKDLKHQINQEILDDMKKQIEVLVDSIEQSRK